VERLTVTSFEWDHRIVDTSTMFAARRRLHRPRLATARGVRGGGPGRRAGSGGRDGRAWAPPHAL